MRNYENMNEIISFNEKIKLKKISPIEWNIDKIDDMRTMLLEKGYVFLRNVFNKEKVEKALELITDYLKKNRNNKKEGIILSGYEPISHHTNFLNLVEGKEIKNVMNCILQEESETLTTKWIRVLAFKEYTNTHSDFYRFAKFPHKLYTCWIPLVSQGIREGTISLYEKSHLMNFDSEIILNEELPIEFLEKVENSEWTHFEFKVGDLLIFDIKTIHCSFRNDSDILRINCDTRWIKKKKI